MKEVKLTAYLTDLPVMVDVESIETYRGGTFHTTIYFKDGATAMVTEDFDKVDELITEALK